MRAHVAVAIIVLAILVPAGARAQCLAEPTGPAPRVPRAQQAARARAWDLAERFPQSRQDVAALGVPTWNDSFPIVFSDALPDSTFVLYEFRFGADFYSIMKNRAGREWLDAVSLTVAKPEWPAVLQIGASGPAGARGLGRPTVVTTAGDSTIQCYVVRATRGGGLFLHYVRDTLRRVTWSLDLP